MLLTINMKNTLGTVIPKVFLQWYECIFEDYESKIHKNLLFFYRYLLRKWKKYDILN